MFILIYIVHDLSLRLLLFNRSIYSFHFWGKVYMLVVVEELNSS